MLCMGTYEILPSSKDNVYKFAAGQSYINCSCFDQVASTWTESFDTLLDAYKQLAENIPLLAQYQHMFQSDPRMASILAIMYEDILEFHQVALRVFKQSSMPRTLFSNVH